MFPHGLPAPGSSPLATSVFAPPRKLYESDRTPTVMSRPVTENWVRARAALSCVTPSDTNGPLGQAAFVIGRKTSCADSTNGLKSARESRPAAVIETVAVLSFSSTNRTRAPVARSRARLAADVSARRTLTSRRPDLVVRSSSESASAGRSGPLTFGDVPEARSCRTGVRGPAFWSGTDSCAEAGVTRPIPSAAAAMTAVSPVLTERARRFIAKPFQEMRVTLLLMVQFRKGSVGCCGTAHLAGTQVRPSMQCECASVAFTREV